MGMKSTLKINTPFNLIAKKNIEKVRNGFAKAVEFSKQEIRNDLMNVARQSLKIKTKNFAGLFRFKLYDKDKSKPHIGASVYMAGGFWGIFDSSNRTIRSNKGFIMIPLQKQKNRTEFIKKVQSLKNSKMTYTKKIDGEIFIFVKGNRVVNKSFRGERRLMRKAEKSRGAKFGIEDDYPIAILRRQIQIRKTFKFQSTVSKSFEKSIRKNIDNFIKND